MSVYYKGVEIPEMNYNITIDAKLQEKAIDITVNGSTVISPDSNYDALSGVTVNVNVPSSGGGESSGEGILDFGSIGYTDEEVPSLWKEGLEYAKEIQENWDSSKPTKFEGDNKLVFLPAIDTSKVTNALSYFQHSKKLTIIPYLDLSGASSLQYCFMGCTSLSSEIKLNTSNCTDFYKCFMDCISLTTILELDTSKADRLSDLFHGCTSLTTIPQLDTSNATNMASFFTDCSSLTTIPQLDTSKVTSFYGFFDGCSSLTTIPQLDTSNATDMKYFIADCKKLKKVEGISFKNMGSISSATNFIFGYSSNTSCRYLLIKDIGTNSSCTTIDATNARVWGIADSEVPDARQSLIDSLLTYSFDRASAGYSNCTIKLYSTVKAVLTEDEINSIQAKGYIIS